MAGLAGTLASAGGGFAPRNPLDPNQVQSPVMQLRLNGVFIPTWRGMVELTAYSVADTANFDTFLASAPLDYGALCQTVKACPYEVFIGQRGQIARSNPAQRVLYALLEEEEATYEEDRIELRARGVLALLIDQRVTARVPMNQTADKIIAGIISQFGLTPQVAATSVPVGKLLQDDYVAMSRNYRALEFITALADELGWDVRVQGTTVIVGPPAVRGTVPEISKVWSNNAGEKLRVTHNSLHSRNIKVVVKSYLPRLKSRTASLGANANNPAAILGLPAQTPTAPVSRGPSGNQTGFTSVGGNYTGEIYTFHIPGLTAQQCDNMAGKIRDDLTRREFIVEFTWSPSLQEAQTIVSAGTEWTLNLTGCSQRSSNQVYHPKKVTWNWESGEDDASPSGLTCTVLGVNHELPAPTSGI